MWNPQNLCGPTLTPPPKPEQPSSVPLSQCSKAMRGGGCGFRIGDTYLRGRTSGRAASLRRSGQSCGVSSGPHFFCEDQIKNGPYLKSPWVNISPKGINYSKYTSQLEEPYIPGFRPSTLCSGRWLSWRLRRLFSGKYKTFPADSGQLRVTFSAQC